ncbi:hypothetical protein [Vibrio metschnikovii]|uniref:hypothetical protein n=1 Tax=Vibrio metschnikovii TaxID=28172 RepID=UPI00164CB5D1|nr:hypothetical protein [Vibrio metschnikovii]MBC5830888.1 hypothetical protein [Vibrio metschnikovii]
MDNFNYFHSGLKPILILNKDSGVLNLHGYKVFNKFDGEADFEKHENNLPHQYCSQFVFLKNNILLFSGGKGSRDYFIYVSSKTLINNELTSELLKHFSGIDCSNINLVIEDSGCVSDLTYCESLILEETMMHFSRFGFKFWLGNMSSMPDFFIKNGNVVGVEISKNHLWYDDSKYFEKLVDDFKIYGLKVLVEGVVNANLLSRVVDAEVDLVQDFLCPDTQMQFNSTLINY